MMRNAKCPVHHTIEKLNSLQKSVFRAAGGMIGLKVISQVLSVITGVLLARILGVSGYGAYAHAMAWVVTLGVPAILGLDKLLVRNIAAYEAVSAWDLMKGLLKWANRLVLILSIGLAALMTAGTKALLEYLDFTMVSVLWLALFILPFLALSQLRRAALQGLNHIVAARVPELIIRPLIFIGMIGCTYLFVGKDFSAHWAVTMNALAFGVAFVIGAYMLCRALPAAIKRSSPVFRSHEWMRSAVPMSLVGGMEMVNTQAATLMLGAMMNAEAVGLYTVASRAAQIIILVQMACNAALTPTIARLYGAGQMENLQGIVTASARMVLLITLLLTAGLVAFGDRLLSLFGSDFPAGYQILVILSIGWTCNAASGAVGVLLIMTKYERDAAAGIGLTAVLNLLLMAILIPNFGAEGAAVATTVTMIARNLLLMGRVYQKLGIHSTAFGKIKARIEA